jgi:molybdopterin-guanine dinucleotide biosynthesis protein A
MQVRGIANFIEKHRGKWIFLVSINFPLSELEFFDTLDDAFDAGCDKGSVPPVVFTVQVADRECETGGIIITDKTHGETI